MNLYYRFALAIITAAGISGAAAQTAPQDTLVTLPDSFVAPAPLSASGASTISQAALSSSDLGATLPIVVNLKYRNFEELKARVTNHERFTYDQLKNNYFPLADTYAQVSNWLTSNGLVLGPEDPNHIHITATGSVSQLAATFQTQFAKVATIDGVFTSAISAPSIPASIADGIIGVSGLQPQLIAHNHLKPSKDQNAIASGSYINADPPSYTTDNFYFLTANDFRAMYNAPSNLTGAGQTVAIIIDTIVNEGNSYASGTDLYNYNSYTGTTFTGSFINVPVNGATPSFENNNHDVTEGFLDVEMVMGMAPAANIRVYNTASLAPSNVELALSTILSDIRSGVKVTVISMSFGYGEQTYIQSADIQTMDQDFVALSALGVTNVASSGDYGYLDFNPSNIFSTQVEYPASDPYVTGVGGTTLHTDVTQTLTTNSNTTLTSGDYIGETVYSTYNSNTGGNPAYASGGGVSQHFAIPSWQIGNGTVLQSEVWRCVPDVSCPWGIIVNHSGNTDTQQNATWEGSVAVMFTNINSDPSHRSSVFFVEPVGGTSVAAPVFAGIVALINQARGSNGPIGFLNPWLYELGESTQWNAFRDVTANLPNVLTSPLSGVGGTGTYSTYYNINGTSEYSAGPLYDLCTGLGSPNINNLTNALSSGIYAVQPQSQTVAVGSSVVFSAFAELNPYQIAPASYQWLHNGVAISGATSPQLLVTGSNTQLSNNGDTYQCSVTISNSGIPTAPLTTQPATLTVINTSTPGHLTNLSTRAYAGTAANNQSFIGGFVVAGSGSEPILALAVGPTLASFGLSGVLAEPYLTVETAGGTVEGTDAAWGGGSTLSNAFSAVGQFALPTNSLDSALLFATGLSSSNLAAGAYTAPITSVNNGSGIALYEVYDANPALGSTWSSGMPYLSNVSARAWVGTGANEMFGGFVLAGSTSRTLLIRATGPTLANFGLSGVLPDPVITLYNSSGTAFASNKVWNGNPLISTEASNVGAFSWATNSNDSAIVVTVPPGSYTVEVWGADGDSGNALFEVYLIQ